MKYRAIWYNQESFVKIDVIEAANKEDATSKAYLKYNGNPPAPLLSIEEEE